MIGALVLAVGLAAGMSSPTELRPAPCHRIEWQAGVAQRERLIRCAARRYDVPGGPRKALEVARCESGPNLDPRAVYGWHRGIYQHVEPLWPARAEKYLWRWYAEPREVDPFDALANVLVTMQMVTDRNIGWTPWSCA